MTEPLSIPLVATPTGEAAGAWHRVPLTAGVPLPRGAVNDLIGWTLRGPDTRDLPLQLAATERWPDGSLRWMLLDTQVDLPAGSTTTPLTLVYGSREDDVSAPAEKLVIQEQGRTVSVDTGAAQFRLSSDAPCILQQCRTPAGSILERCTITITGENGNAWTVQWDSLAIEVAGPLRGVVAARGVARDSSGSGALALQLRLEFFAGLGAIRLELTTRNSRRAEHRGGIWELGDSGSVFLKELSLSFGIAGTVQAPVRWSTEPGATEQTGADLRIYQDSSGGENWASTNHVNRHGKVSPTFRGYSVESTGVRTTGLRATPSVTIGQSHSQIGIAVPKFWQNFPRALGATTSEAFVSFFPAESADAHELQGGEQKRHECFVLIGEDAVSPVPLDWCRTRPVLHAEPRWYAQTNAVPYLITGREDDGAYRALVDAAIEGSDTFFHKREIADEYGWRHFGDIYGDHEGVFHKGPTPLMSHYNNQYDPVGGFLYQFMRTGDPRWWTQCVELTAHVIDIDIYHTDQDKAAYNNGLFWHTYHYVDAAKANHRTYPPGTVGGGPSSEQNYTTGLMLHHLVTGDTAARDAALGLAQFVIDMDDGKRTVFRWLDGGYTGVASASRNSDYHGPGRGSANSLNALVDGHRITGDRKFLDKAEQIIRRCTHPRQDIERLELLDPENRWFYTMYLQSLAKYLDWKIELGELDAMYAYGRAVLLHFATWMAKHERPYLDRADLLEYPTETWPAQDIRKSEVFDAAARHADAQDRERFVERAEFFFNYCTSTLLSMPTRSLARPVVLLIAHGHRRAHARSQGIDAAPAPRGEWESHWPTPSVFVGQRARAIKRAKMIVAGGAAMATVAIGLLGWWLIR